MTNLATQGREQLLDSICFCTHCGALADDAPRRVCPDCGLGVMLACSRDAAPRAGAPFLVVTTDLRVSAASANVEPLFGDPSELVGVGVLDLIHGDDAFTRQVTRSAMGSRRGATAWVRTREHGRPHKARIATCGNPPAALLVLS
jgi:hypothetical protein